MESLSMVAGPVVLLIQLNKVCTLSQSKYLPLIQKKKNLSLYQMILILSYIYELYEIYGLIASLLTSIS